MTRPPEEWTDADPASLPRSWRDPDEDDEPTACDRCGAGVDDATYCEDCRTLLDRARARR